MLQLRLLGPFATTIDSDSPVQIRIRSKKGRALLAFLAVHDGHSVSRDQLIGLLWGNPVDTHPRQNLRQCLISVRADLGQLAPDLLVTGIDRIGLTPARLRIDAVELAELAKSNDLADLERAVALYRGQFLADLRIGLKRFDEWLQSERSRLEAIVAQLLERCANWFENLGNGERALDAATRLVRLDPRREDWQRRLLRLYARYRGCDAAASRATWVIEFLRKELSAGPAPETISLVTDIQHRRIPPARPTVALSTANDFTQCANLESSLNAGKKPTTAVRRDRPSIRVLPFVNLSADEELGYLCRGISEDIVIALARTKSYCVIAPSTFFTETTRTRKALNGGYVLCGTVRRLNDNIRITVRLADSNNDIHIWAQAYTSKARDISADLDSICSNVVAAIEPNVLAIEAVESTRKPLHALDAHGCVMRALSLLSVRTLTNHGFAGELLERAIQLDANCARAYSISAYFAGMSVLSGWKPRESTLRRAFETAQRALLIDANDPWGHFALGWVLTQSRATELGVEEYEKAIALAPHFPHARSCLGLALAYLGKIDRALTEVEAAARFGTLEILAGLTNSARAGLFFCAERYHDAILAARRSVQESPGLVASQRQLVVNHALAGEIDEARAALTVFKQLVPNATLQKIAGSLPNIHDREQTKILEAFHKLGLE
jgi:DNA-binding SARP family transcriptional activator